MDEETIIPQRIDTNIVLGPFYSQAGCHMFDSSFGSIIRSLELEYPLQGNSVYVWNPITNLWHIYDLGV